MKMWRVNMKIWIVTIICSTVSCKVAIYYDDQAASTYNETTKHNTLTHLTPCTNCGSSSLITLAQGRQIDELDIFNAKSNYVESKLNVKRQVINTSDELGAEIPTFARCTPTPQVVSFVNETDSDSLYYYNIRCTRVNRCGGCCPEATHSCQPSNIRLRKFRVQKFFDDKIEHVEKLIVEHLSCQCACRVKQESCTQGQKYDARDCRCHCENTDEKRNCLDNSAKSWDHDKCECSCETKFRDCTTPQQFDENTCTCR